MWCNYDHIIKYYRIYHDLHNLYTTKLQWVPASHSVAVNFAIQENLKKHWAGGGGLPSEYIKNPIRLWAPEPKHISSGFLTFKLEGQAMESLSNGAG